MAPADRDRNDFTRRLPAPATFAAPGHGVSSAPSFIGRRSHQSIGSRMRGALARAAEAAWVWHERSRQRWALSELSDYMLCDIGISRAEAIGEAAKPFWRG